MSLDTTSYFVGTFSGLPSDLTVLVSFVIIRLQDDGRTDRVADRILPLGVYKRLVYVLTDFVTYLPLRLSSKTNNIFLYYSMEPY